MPGKVHIGTSGWHYKHWIGSFYPKDIPPNEMFRFYAEHFDTVEINNTFYRLPQLSTFDNWRSKSPPNFRFAVKASRFITHMKKLKDPQTSMAKFFLAVERLEKKLGPILFQLPPSWKVDPERFSEFLKALPAGHQYVVEFRDQSWLVAQVFALLRKHNIAFCIHDLGESQTPLELTADFTYVRFHGPGTAKYTGSYRRSDLRRWAVRIDEWAEELTDVYIYFNNDVGGYAIKDALILKSLLVN